MKFELLGGSIVNFDHIESIAPLQATDLQSQYAIRVTLHSGQNFELFYKEESARDMKFKSLVDSLCT